MSGRRTALLLLASLLAGVLVVATQPAGADVDDEMILGRANGAKGWNTSLYSWNHHASLTIFNKNDTGAPALNLWVKNGPALKVNTTAKVANLNADLLDGYSSNRFRVLRSGCASDLIGYPGSSWNCESGPVSLPTAGIVDMTGSVDLYNSGDFDDKVWCYFQIRVDGGSWTKIDSTDRDVHILPDDYGICATDGWHFVPAAASIEVRFGISNIGANTTLGQHSSWWIFIPN